MTEEYKPHESLQFFAIEHLREDLKNVVRPFQATAEWVSQNIEDNFQKEMALLKLIESKDCAVRAKLLNISNKSK